MPAIFGLLFLFAFYIWFNPGAVEAGPTTSLSVSHNAPLSREKAELELNAQSLVVFDEASGFRLHARNAEEVRSIASLTKLMSALVFLDHEPQWQQTIIMQPEDYRGGARANLFSGDRIELKDLFTIALTASDNTAVAALVRSTGLTEAEFVQAMNDKAKLLRLRTANFADPTGLAPANQASAVDIAKLAKAAFARPEIREALAHSRYEAPVSTAVSREVQSTNKLLGQALPAEAKLIAGKTGHLDEAGYCFAGLFESEGRRIVTVVLGAEAENQRFSETTKLLDWALESYSWN